MCADADAWSTTIYQSTRSKHVLEIQIQKTLIIPQGAILLWSGWAHKIMTT